MINKNLLNKKVIKALSIGLSTAMIMQPVASMAEEAPATETPDGFVVKVVEEKPVEETEFFEETPDFFEEAEAVDELLDKAEFKETVAGAEAVLSFEVPVILNEVAAVIDDTQAEEKLADTEELVADAQDEITAKIDEVEEDLEEREKVIDNAKNLADEANAAAQKVQDDVDDADALLAEAEAAKTSAEAAAISEEIKDLADDAEAQAAIAEAKAAESEAAQAEAEQMYNDAAAKYNEAVEYAAAKVEEANTLLAEGTEDAKDAWIDAQRALNAARALQATTNFALKGAEAYVSTVEKELIDAKLELLQAQADLKQAAADKVSADLKVVAEGIDLVEAGVLLETAKGAVKLADANLEAKEKALQDLYDKKAAADAEVARLKKAYEDAKADEKTDKATLDRIQGEYNALVTALNAANSAISELEGQIETEKANLAGLNSDLQDKIADTAAAQAALTALNDDPAEQALQAAEEAYKADPSQENLEALIKIMLEQNYDGEFTKSVNVDDNGQAVFIKDGNAAEGYIYTIDENGKVDVFEKDISQQNVRSDVYEAADENKYATAEDALAGISEEDIANGLYKAVGNGDAVEAVEGEEAKYTVKYSTEENVLVKKAGTVEDGGYDWLNGDNYKKLSPDDLPKGAQIIVRSDDLFGGEIGEIFNGGEYYYTYTYTRISDGYYYFWKWIETGYHYAWVCDQKTYRQLRDTDHVRLLYANDVYETQVVPHEFTGIKESELGNYPEDAEIKQTKAAVPGIAGQSETYSLQKLSAVEEKSGISKDEFEALTKGLTEGVDYIKTKTTRLVSDEQVVPGSEEVFNGQAKNFDFAQYVGKEGYKVLYDGKEILRAGSKDGKYYLDGEEKEKQISNGNGKLVVLNLNGTGSTVIPAVYEDIYDLTLFTNSQYVISGDDDSDFNQSASKLIDEITAKTSDRDEAQRKQQDAQKLYDDKDEKIKGLERSLEEKKTTAGDKQTEVNNKKVALDEADAAEKEAKRVLAEAKAAKEAAEKAYNGYYNNGIKGYFTGITIVPSSYELDVAAAKAKVTQAEIELGLAQAAKKLAQDNYDESVKEFNAAVKASEQALVELVKAELRRDADILVVAGKEIKLAGAKSAYNAAKNANDYALRLKADAKAARDAAKAAYDAYKALSVEDISAEELAAAKAAYEAAKLDYDFKLAAAKEASKLAEGAKKDYEDALEQVSKLAEQERLAAEEAERLAAEEAARLAAEEAARLAAEEAARLAAETNTAEAPATEEVIAIATTGAATTTTTTTTTAQVVEIEDEDTALAEAPEEEEEVVLSIDEEGTPLAGDIEYLDLEEEEVPQAPAPEGSMSWWWLFIIAALGATGFEMYRRYNLKKTAKANKNNK